MIKKNKKKIEVEEEDEGGGEDFSNFRNTSLVYLLCKCVLRQLIKIL